MGRTRDAWDQSVPEDWEMRTLQAQWHVEELVSIHTACW